MAFPFFKGSIRQLEYSKMMNKKSMSKIPITGRDVLVFKYLHSCNFATNKQINRDDF